MVHQNGTPQPKSKNCHASHNWSDNLFLHDRNIHIRTSRPNFPTRSRQCSICLLRMDRTNDQQPLGHRRRHRTPSRKRHKNRQDRRRERKKINLTRSSNSRNQEETFLSKPSIISTSLECFSPSINLLHTKRCFNLTKGRPIRISASLIRISALGKHPPQFL